MTKRQANGILLALCAIIFKSGVDLMGDPHMRVYGFVVCVSAFAIFFMGIEQL